MVVTLWTDDIEQTVTTPLSLMTKHFKDVKSRAHDLSLEIKRERFITLCSSKWPSLNVGWPPKGTLNLPILLQVKQVIFRPGRQGHPDQIPYVLTWQDLIETPPVWLKPFLHPPMTSTKSVLTLQERESPMGTPTPCTRLSALLYPILQNESDEEILLPAPYQPQVQPGGTAAEGAKSQAAPDSGAPTTTGPAAGTRGRAHKVTPPAQGPADSTVLPLRAIAPPDGARNQMLYLLAFCY